MLHECLLARDVTAAQVERAKATADRAAAYVERCQANVADFADLEAQITERTIEALRSGEGRPRGGQDDELRQRIAERDVARANATAAERAAAVLVEGLVDARTDAEHAITAARRAAVAVAAMSRRAAGAAGDRIRRRGESEPVSCSTVSTGSPSALARHYHRSCAK